LKFFVSYLKIIYFGVLCFITSFFWIYSFNMESPSRWISLKIEIIIPVRSQIDNKLSDHSTIIDCLFFNNCTMIKIKENCSFFRILNFTFLIIYFLIEEQLNFFLKLNLNLNLGSMFWYHLFLFNFWIKIFLFYSLSCFLSY
jgi:hypothetical protein